ncbi:MAG: PHP domain-containing protein [Victivallaceae bacterium]|nr:PHP domain-containing protein [Victivallaceae bacterium]
MNKTVNYDLHMHTTFSDGKSPLEDVVRAAIANGLDCIALTDHIFPGCELGWLDEYRQAVDSYKDDLLILVGGEGCILNPEGDISVDAEMRDKLDILLVDFGYHTDRIAKNCTGKEQLLRDIKRAMISLCENPLVDIVAHPFNFGRIPIPLTPGDIPDSMLHDIAVAFAETGTVFEIMNTMTFWFPELSVEQVSTEYLHIVEVFKAHDVRFSVGSDAHSCCGVGNIKWSERIIATAEIEKLLINPREMFAKRQWLATG